MEKRGTGQGDQDGTSQAVSAGEVENLLRLIEVAIQEYIASASFKCSFKDTVSLRIWFTFRRALQYQPSTPRPSKSYEARVELYSS